VDDSYTDRLLYKCCSSVAE
ncbi:hypothetical protein CCACVL1_03011, partial [Corchorus capsularis]